MTDQAERIAKLRRAYEAFSSGDFDAVAEFIHPDIEYVAPAGLSSLHGLDEFRQWMEPDAFDRQEVEPVQIEIAGNKALVRQHGRMRGAGSGIEMEVSSWAVFTVDADDRLVRFEVFPPHEEDEARRAAGLESESASP